MSFLVAGAICADVGGSPVAPRIVNAVSYVRMINHESFSVAGRIIW